MTKANAEGAGMPMEPNLLEDLKRRAPVLGKLQPPEQMQVATALQQVCIAFSGPLPPPEALAKYDETIPNGADRIMKMAETQQSHRIELEKAAVQSQQRQSQRGQLFGFMIAIAFLIGGVAVTLAGHDWVGGIILGTTICSLVGVFVAGRRVMARDLKSKSE